MKLNSNFNPLKKHLLSLSLSQPHYLSNIINKTISILSTGTSDISDISGNKILLDNINNNSNKNINYCSFYNNFNNQFNIIRINYINKSVKAYSTMEKEINNNENTNNNDIKDKQDNRMEVSDDEGSNMYIDDDGDAKRINNKNNNNKKESKKIIKEFDKDARDRLNNNDNEKKEENEEKFEKIKLPKRKYAIVHGYIGHKYSGNQK